MPSRDVVQRALEQVRKRSANYEYFFDRLKSPEWIAPLRDEGFFQTPPPPVREGEYVRFPIWPESRYLARMAPLASEPVLQVVLKMPETENVRVHEDLADVALGLPAELAIRLLTRAKKWSESPYQLLLPDKLGELTKRLATAEQIDASIDLARALLAVVPDPRADREADQDGSELYDFLPEPQARIDQWQYEHLLETHLKSLTDAWGNRALMLFSDLLEEAVRLAQRDSGKDQAADLSYVWRPAVEEDRQNVHHGIKDVLVSAVRDVACRLVANEPGSLSEVIRELEARSSTIFERIALHVLRTAEAVPPDVIRQRLSNPDLVDDVSVFHEFWLLARDRLPELDQADVDGMLASIDSGPDRAEVRAGLERWGTEPVSNEEVEKSVKSWQLRRLSILREVIPPTWLGVLGELEKELGEHEHPEFLSYLGELKTGPNSPLAREEIEAMPMDELIDYLRSWEAPAEWMGPSPEGLARELTSIVGAAPEQYADRAEAFRGLDATYVRGLIQGLERAHKDTKNFIWEPVLTLCEWVMEQPREISERKGAYADLDPGWVWTRKAIASLLSSGFDATPNEIPHELRPRIWELLAVLSEDPEPTPDQEARDGSSYMEPANLSINTTRGEAMHAVIRYALWVRRELESDENAAERLARGFDEMSEVRDVIEKHLDVAHDPSLAVRAVYGQWLPWLILLDRAWVEAHLSQIFPREVGYEGLRDAAWDTFIVFCRPYDVSFDVLGAEYELAIGRISDSPDETQRPDSRDAHLAEHISTYYWQGKLPLDDSDNLLGRFLSTAPSRLRGHALDFIGRSLRNSEGEVPVPIIERLKTLWSRRFEASRTFEAREDVRQELGAFGWWFASGKFDVAWSLTQLEEALKAAGGIDANHLVAQQLVVTADSDPEATLRCLRLMIEADETGWGVAGWRDEIEEIVRKGLNDAGGQAARELATEVVHRLGARGYREFGHLLHEES